MTQIQTVILIETDAELGLEEICQALQITPDFIHELIAYGAIEPKGHSASALRFDMYHVRQIRRALHLLNDLEVNMPGAVLAMDLMDKIEKLQAEVDLFENYLHQGLNRSEMIK